MNKYDTHLWPTTRPVPYARNARKIPQQAVDKVAASIKEYGWQQPIVVDSSGVIIAGHTRLLAAQKLGLETVPVHVADNLTPQQAKAYRLADNRIAQETEFDEELLKLELGELFADGYYPGITGFDADEVANLLITLTERESEKVPEIQAGEAHSKRGEVYELGPHRLMCGDSTSAADVLALMGEERSPLLHADPPYGMGKESDGVENDNLYRDKLDAFQMAWWETWRNYLHENGSVYIWGTSEDLFRLWYSGGLKNSGALSLRNEIVWNKENGMGQNSSEHRQFATATERCLFLMLGVQDFGNVNKDDFPPAFAPILAYMEEQARAMSLAPADVKKLCGVHMWGHWFSRSQWTMIPEKHYLALRAASNGLAFQRDYSELRKLYDSNRDDLKTKRDFYKTRAFFDNEHDNMTDVWNFPRVLGDDRQGHATPKPVELITRAIKSSAPIGSLVMEPFGGSGSTLIAAAVSGRVARVMEISEKYCDVIRRRWTKFSEDNKQEPGAGALV
jgi:DNA modification methylase